MPEIRAATREPETMVGSAELAEVRVTAPENVRDAALRLRASVERRLGDWRVASCTNIASSRPMFDGAGAILATTAFGWTDL
ncbi:MAG: hypothetical protein K0B16_17060, partial [Burkholderiaceae bacterium]|nr:hypothetical protein [Burkholderiaceae bacterium]